MLLWLVAAAVAAALALVLASPFRVEFAGRLEGGTVRARLANTLFWGLLARESETSWSVTGWRAFPPALRLRAGAGALPPPAVEVAPEYLWRLAGRLRQAATGGSLARRAVLAARPWRVQRLRLRLAVGTGEAALTALCSGAAWAALTALVGAAGGRVGFARPPEVDVAADFSRRGLAAEWECIAETRLGHIIIAGVLALYDTVSRNLVKGAASPGAATPAH